MSIHPLRRAVLSAVLLVASASGQFLHLATNGDGSVVYFATRHPRVGSNESWQGRIYRVVEGRLELFASRDADQPEPPPVGSGMPALSNYYDLSSPSVSSDGSVIAFAGRRDCSGFPSCIGVPTQASTIQLSNGDEREVFGQVSLSPNGRYALRQGGSPYLAPSVVDLETGVETEAPALSGATFSPGTPIANDGTVVDSSGTIQLFRDGETRELTSYVHEEVSEAVIDAEARMIAYVSRWSSYPETAFTRLRILDVATTRRRTLVEGLGEFFGPRISADGSRVLFLSTSRFDDSGQVGPARLFVVEIDGSGLRPLTSGAEAVFAIAFSGDGRVAYAVTGLGRMIRIDLDADNETELIPRTPTLYGGGSSGFGGASVPGSLTSRSGTGLVAQSVFASSFPLPERLGPFRLLMNGQAVPLLSVTPTEVVYQVPWAFESIPPGSNIEVRIEIDESVSQSPFQPDFVGGASTPAIAPFVFSIPAEYGSVGGYGFPLSLAADSEYRLVTRSNPVSPGDFVHAYATGLGPVSPAVRTGEPAPTDGTVSRVLSPFTCRTLAGGLLGGPVDTFEVPVLFAGLAPGYAGVYQVTLQIPANLPNEISIPGLIQISCRYPEGAPSGTFEFHFPIEF